MKIIYGTSNQAKIAQVKDYLDYKNIDVEILSLKDIGFNDASAAIAHACS